MPACLSCFLFSLCAQLLAERTGAVLKFAQIREDMSLDLDHMKSLITEKTKLVAVVSWQNYHADGDGDGRTYALQIQLVVAGRGGVGNQPVFLQVLHVPMHRYIVFFPCVLCASVALGNVCLSAR